MLIPACDEENLVAYPEYPRLQPTTNKNMHSQLVLSLQFPDLGIKGLKSGQPSDNKRRIAKEYGVDIELKFNEDDGWDTPKCCLKPGVLDMHRMRAQICGVPARQDYARWQPKTRSILLTWHSVPAVWWRAPICS